MQKNPKNISMSMVCGTTAEMSDSTRTTFSNNWEKPKPLHSVVSLGALHTIKWAVMDKRDLWRAISQVIVPKRKRSYIRAFQIDSYPNLSQPQLKLDWCWTGAAQPLTRSDNGVLKRGETKWKWQSVYSAVIRKKGPLEGKSRMRARRTAGTQERWDNQA